MPPSGRRDLPCAGVEQIDAVLGVEHPDHAGGEGCPGWPEAVVALQAGSANCASGAGVGLSCWVILRNDRQAAEFVALGEDGLGDGVHNDFACTFRRGRAEGLAIWFAR